MSEPSSISSSEPQASSEPRAAFGRTLAWCAVLLSLSRFELHCLDALLAVLRDSNARVVLMRLPARREYLATARGLPGGRAFIEQVDREIATRLDSRVELFACPRARDCGLRDDIFVDYAHMSRAGAEKFTKRFLAWRSKPPARGR